MKLCVGCRIEKSTVAFSKNCRKKDGLDSYCKPCMKVRSAEHYNRNREKRSTQNKLWREANPGMAAEYSAKWRVNNPGAQSKCDHEYYINNREKVLAADKVRREANIEKYLIRERESAAKHHVARKAKEKRWVAANPHMICAYASRRRAAKLRRTPAWLTPEQIQKMNDMYLAAKLMQKYDGQIYHVDHVVPLLGKTVSGLHVPWNLQLLTQKENVVKNNRVWPDMP